MLTDSCAEASFEVVLGTAQLRAAYGVTRSSSAKPRAEDAEALLLAADARQVAALDTAPAYPDAEMAIGASQWTGSVHTKIDWGVDPATSLARSLTRLNRNHVDILYLHDASELLRSESGVIDSAHRLVGNGVGVLGASVYEIEEFDAALEDPRIGVIQVPMNVFDRRIDEVRLAKAVARGVCVYARSVLLQGVLLTSPEKAEDVVPGLGGYVTSFQEAARSCGLTPLAAALGWVRAAEGVCGVVLGATSVEELHGLLTAAGAAALGDSALSDLRSLTQPEWRLVDPRQWNKVK